MERWVAEAPASIDLTLAEQDRWARKVATEMLEQFPEPGAVARLEQSAADAPVFVRLAMKLAQSRQQVLALRDNFRVSVVFAVYMQSRPMTCAAPRDWCGQIAEGVNCRREARRFLD